MDKVTKISANRQKKEAIVAEVAEKVTKAKAMVFTNFEGLTHRQLEDFKREIRKADAEFAATKNTLLKRALGDQVAGQEDKFQKPTGTIFMYGDIVAPLKTLAKMMKDLEKPTIKFGLLDGKAISESDVKKLATLPAREVLIAQLLGMMNAPIQGFHRALSWNLQKFVMTLDAVAKQKSTAAPAPTAEKPAEVKAESPVAAATPAAEQPAVEAAPAEEAKEEAPAATEQPTETQNTEEETKV